MILIENFSQVIAQIESERGIEKHIILDAIEKALVSAARKKYGAELNVKAYIDENSGEARLWMEKTIVETKTDPLNELLIDEAKELSDDVEVGDALEINLDIEEFGRIATQAAKQVILQCIREAEKDLVIREFSDKVGEIVTGNVQNIEGNTYLINLGKIEAFLGPREQSPGESFNVKDRIRVYIVDIQKTTRGPVVKISRSHSGLIRQLFHLEVPEIQDGIITIKSIARDAGRRTKIAVFSTNQSVGAVGTCVGHMGGRIQAVLREINNEKIDILEWDENPRTFIGNSLKPATITEVIIDNEETKEATVVVPDDQLSLAIGKSGQNVRLAVRLTSWKLDIVSESDHKKKSNPNQSDESTLSEKIKASTQEEESQEEESQEEESQEEESQESNTEEVSTETTDTETTDTEATDTEATDTEATDTEATDTEATDTEATDTEATDTEAVTQAENETQIKATSES